MSTLWQNTEFGTAETFVGRHGVFLSHQYDDEGRADVIRAATHHIETTEDNSAIRAIALHLLETEGPETDLYQRETNERWLVDAKDLLSRATGIFYALVRAAEPVVVDKTGES